MFNALGRSIWAIDRERKLKGRKPVGPRVSRAERHAEEKLRESRIETPVGAEDAAERLRLIARGELWSTTAVASPLLLKLIEQRSGSMPTNHWQPSEFFAHDLRERIRKWTTTDGAF